MKQPTVIDYKDMTPIRATPDNPAIMQDGRIVADGPAAANIPGVVAGLDYLYKKYGSGKVKWAELVEPAIKLADEGFILDEALPTSIAEGRHFLEKWPEAAKIYLPGGKVPKPGERFVNKDYADDAARDCEGRRRHVLSRRDRAQDRRRPRGERRHHRRLPISRSTARSSASRSSAAIAATRCTPAGRRCRPAFSCSSRCRFSTTTSRVPARAPTTDADYFHYALEAWKVRDQVRRVADPERWPVDFAEHLTAEHAKKLFEKIDPKKASRYERQPPDDAPAGRRRRGSRPGTTSFAVADARRQHDRGDADAQHLGRHVLRVEGPGLPLQQSPALGSHDAGRVRQHAAADAIEHRERADAGVREHGERRSAEARGRLRRATRGFRRRSTTSSSASSTASSARRRRSRRRGFCPAAIPPIRARTASSRRSKIAFRARCCRT